MYCDNCGRELADDEEFCSNCGTSIKSKHKNIYVALILTFILSGLGSVYAGNMRNGAILIAMRIGTAIIGVTISSIFLVFSVLVWAYAFYEAYNDVQIANGRKKPKLTNDFKSWNQNRKIIAILIIAIILIFTVSGCYSLLNMNNNSSGGSNTHYYGIGSGGSSSSHSSHYGGVDTSPQTIAKKDPDWYYDHYEYGDNDEIDEYLESQGFD